MMPRWENLPGHTERRITMLLYLKKPSHVSHGPATLREACDRVLNRITGRRGLILGEESLTIAATEPTHNKEPKYSFNASEIQTALIQITGRFCERYASDLLCTLTDLNAFLTLDYINKPNRWIIGVGIRESGVDGNEFIMSRLKDTRSGLTGFVHPEQVYRKVLAIDIQDEGPSHTDWPTRTIRLLDLTHDLTTIHPDDEKERT